MIRKRIIGVITVRDGWAVQSFGYGRWLPMGHPHVIAENLDRWGVDEILLVAIDRSKAGLGPDYATLERVAQNGLSTPLVYSGGIRSAADAGRAISLGADRIVCDALLHDDPQAAMHVGDAIGTQAVIAHLPVSNEGGVLHWLDHRSKVSRPLTQADRDLLTSGWFSEVMLTDWQHEGHSGAFDASIPGLIGIDTPLILFGGISEGEQARALLTDPQVAAIGVGNFLSYTEHAVQHLREAIDGEELRPSVYKVEKVTTYVG